MTFWRRGVHRIGPVRIHTAWWSLAVIGLAWDPNGLMLHLWPVTVDMPIRPPFNTTLVDWVVTRYGDWRLHIEIDLGI